MCVCALLRGSDSPYQLPVHLRYTVYCIMAVSETWEHSVSKYGRPYGVRTRLKKVRSCDVAGMRAKQISAKLVTANLNGGPTVFHSLQIHMEVECGPCRTSILYLGPCMELPC